jgi:hypothetical protein
MALSGGHVTKKHFYLKLFNKWQEIGSVVDKKK